MVIISLALAAVSLSIFFTDLKLRRIYLLQVITLLLCSCTYGLLAEQPLATFLFKAGWLSSQLLLLLLYTRMVKKISFFKAFGLGDLLFFITIVPLFGPGTFVVYYISGLLFSLLVAIIFLAVARPSAFKVPLAGLFSVWMLPFLMWEDYIEVISYRLFAIQP